MSPAPLIRALTAQLILGPLSRRHYERLPALPPALDERPVWPRVSIVVPARDEAARLPALLRSLRALDYPDRAVIVVDDDSTDDTAAVADRAGAGVVRSAPLPHGWTGKSHACRQGAEAADGALLLFTDADTVHEPSSLRAAVAYLEREELGALSLITGQRCATFFERLLLPVAYAVLFAGVSPRRINGSSVGTGTGTGAGTGAARSGRGASPLANGQYILCRRADYDRVGGHAAVRGSIIEDAALARAFIRAGTRYRLCRAESLVGVRMYGGLRELWAGFRKNAARYVLDDPRRLPATVLYSTALGAAAPLLIQAAVQVRRPGPKGPWQGTDPEGSRTRRGLEGSRTRPGPKGRGQETTKPDLKKSWQGTDPEGSTPDRFRGDLLRSVACHGPLGPGPRRSSCHGPLGPGPRRSSCHGPLGPGRSRSGRRRLLLALAFANYLAGAAGLVPWYRRFGVPARYAALYPLAVGVFGLVTADSLWRVLGRRGSSWKGRVYR